MLDGSKISSILQRSPSVDVLKMRNRELILVFLADQFAEKHRILSSEIIHSRLADYLEYRQVENDEETDIQVFDSYELKAKKYITDWTNRGFLSNFQTENGEVFYELSSHTSKTLDWINSLDKDEYVGTESKFKTIVTQLKELVEFSNDNKEERLEILETRKKEIEQEMMHLRLGESLKVYEDFEIIPRVNQITQAAKELLSDFKEVEDNFKTITKEIYQRHNEGSLSKSEILDFTFNSLDSLKESPQGKSFYAFWNFLLNPSLQTEWDQLTQELYATLSQKEIEIQDAYLKNMKKHLHAAGQKVYKANDKMADKLSKVIRETQVSNTKATKKTIQDIKKSLIKISQQKETPDISLMVDDGINIHLPFDRKLTMEQTQETVYDGRPTLAESDISKSEHLERIFNKYAIDKQVIRDRINEQLSTQKTLDLNQIIENSGGLQKGLPELFAFIAISNEYKNEKNDAELQEIVFNQAEQKSIQIPTITLSHE